MRVCGEMCDIRTVRMDDSDDSPQQQKTWPGEVIDVSALKK